MTSKKDQQLQTERLIWRAWLVFIVLLFGSLVAETVVHTETKFGPEELPFFYAWFGFASCALIVLFSKALGVVLKRPEDYYEE
jgi:hypothetical protein